MDHLNTHLTEEQIAQCADLLQKQRNIPPVLQQHLDDCSSCKYELISVMELSTANNRSFNLHVQKSWLYAAAASVLILIGTAVYFSLQEKKSPEMPQMVQQELPAPQQPKMEEMQETTPIDSIETPPQPEQLAMYIPNPQLEQLVDRFRDQMRSEMNIREIQMQVNNHQIAISWQQDASEELSFELYDNSGNLRKTLETKSSPLKIENLGDGLYYIKVMNADFDLLQCLKAEIGK